MERNNKITRYAISALLVAVYVVLSSPMLVLSIGGVKVTFEHFPVVLCAIVYGPVEAMLVGGIGEFLNQMMTFGLTPTTMLWILPIVIRGLAVGVGGKIFKAEMMTSAIIKKKVPVLFLIVCIVSGVLSSCFNTLALYVDSKMFGYYTFALVFGAFAVRVILSIVTSVLIGIAIKPVLHALHYAHFV